MALDQDVRQDDIVDVDLSETQKKRFRIDGDNSRIIYLNTSDWNILKRLKSVYPKLEKLAANAAVQMDNDKLDEDAMIKKLDEIDEQMRQLINDLFDDEIDGVVAPDGTMFDLFNGMFRFEYIIERLFKLYEDSIKSEQRKVIERVSKHTNKYTRK